MLIAICFSTLQAQNDTLVKRGNATEYEKLMDSNFKDSLSIKYIKSRTEKESNYSGNWIIGAGINMVEDSGKQNFSNLTESKYNHFGSPFMLSGEYLTSSKFSLSATFLLNKFQSEKEIQGFTIQTGEEPNYFGVDFTAKLFFRRVLDKHKFTPYVAEGPGYRNIESYEAKNIADNLVEVPKHRILP